MNADSADEILPVQHCPIDAKSPDGKILTLEFFLTTKLGVSAGKRLFKELVTTVKDAGKSSAGSFAIDLSHKGGQFISVRELK
jgi:hypothetical protein